MGIKKLGFIKELDTFRFIAVALVMVSHWIPNYFVNKLPNGFIGVTFFFVLSGFLISHNLLAAKKEIDEDYKITAGKVLVSFYLRRTLRIFPLYYLVITILFLVNKNIFGGDIIWYVTYSSNVLFFVNQEWPGMLSHFWSLAVEEQFYLVWPLLVLFIPRRYLLHLFVITIASSVVFKLVMKIFFPTLFYPDLLPIGAFDAFGLGAILAYQQVYGHFFRLLNTRNLLWAFPFLIVTLVLYVYGFRLWMLFFPYVAILIIHQSLIGYNGIAGKVLSNPITVYLGKISYGLYVYHNFIPWLVRCLRGTETTYPISISPFWENWNPSMLSTLLVELLLLIAIASLSWFCVEKPLNKLKRYFEA